MIKLIMLAHHFHGCFNSKINFYLWLFLKILINKSIIKKKLIKTENEIDFFNLHSVFAIADDHNQPST